MNNTAKLLALVFALSLPSALRAAELLEQQFQNPPDSVKPSCYWMWFNSTVDKQGITRDKPASKSCCPPAYSARCRY